MKNHPFTDNFLNTQESESLIDATDARRITEVVRLKKADLFNLAEKKAKNFHGYEYELESWRFFESLKPDFISNISGNFKFDLSEYRSFSKNIDQQDRAYQSSKQTDVLAIFGKHVFVIECKSTQKRQSAEKLSKEIELFKSLNQHKTKRIHKIFGPEYIPVFIVCTKGYELDSSDQIHSLKKDGIILFSEKYMDYIEAVLKSSESPEFALIQFLGFFRSGEQDYNHVKKDEDGNIISKEPWKLMAFQSNSGTGKKNNVYTFSIAPNDMLKISTVSHQKAKVIFETQSTTPKHYQRLLQKGRLKKIGEHLNNNKTPFPNNILVSYRGREKLNFKELKRTKKANVGRFAGELSFNACPGTFHVIDGQHRLFGYTAIENKPKGLRDTHRLIVTVFEGLDIEEEAEIFLEVNQEAKPVHASLIMEIQYSTEKVSQINLANGIVFTLRDKPTSVLHKKINQAEETRKAPLQTKNFQSAIMPLKILNGKNYKSGIFWNFNTSSWKDMLRAQENIYQHLNENLKIISSHNKDRWKKEKGILQDIFFQGILDVIDRVTMYVWRNIGIDDGQIIAPEKITGKTKSIIKHLAESIAKASDADKDDLFNMKRYGKGSQARNSVAAVLVDKFLSSKFRYLKYDGDDEYLRFFNSSSMQPQEVRKILKHNKLLEDQITKLKNRVTKKKKSRLELGKSYHIALKNLVHLILQKEDHYDVDYWESLIMPGFWKEGNVWDEILKRWNQEKASAGANAYKYPMNHVEGKPLRQILMFPQKHRQAKPKDNREQRIESTLNYIWDHFLIFEHKEDQELYSAHKTRGQDNSPLWKKGTEYIDLFEEFRNYDVHRKLKDETANPLADKEELFDNYEKQFSAILDEISRDLELDKTNLPVETEN